MSKYIGQTFNHLTIQSIWADDGRQFCDVRCSCGNTRITRLDRVVNGRVISCGCKRRVPNHNRPSQKKLLKDYNDLRVMEIAKKYNVCVATVYKWLKFYEIKPVKNRAMTKKPSKDELLKLCDEFESAAAIGRHCDATTRSVLNWCKDYGIECPRGWDEYEKPNRETLAAMMMGETRKTAARKRGCSPSLLDRWMRQYDLSKFECENGYKLELPNSFTNVQSDVVKGVLLGDASIPWTTIERNSGLSYGQESSKEDYVRHIADIMYPFVTRSPFTSWHLKPIRRDGKVIHDHCDHNKISGRCYITSHVHPLFSGLRGKWYLHPSKKRSKKIVPRDLVLNWRIFAYWMCDDGYNKTGYGENWERVIKLYTDSFGFDDVEFLISRMSIDLGVTSKINQREGKPTIRISSADYDHVIDNIAPYITVPSMKYKIDKSPKKYRSKLLTDSQISELKEQWKCGKLKNKQSQFARKFGVSHTVINKTIRSFQYEAKNGE